MTDRFLFRGKRTDNGKWITGDLAHFGNETWIFLSTEDITKKKCYHIDPATQCTGLRDKNGVLIFEGDIVVVSGAERAKIEWHVNLGCFITDSMHDSGFLGGSSYMEVIGSIYDEA